MSVKDSSLTPVSEVNFLRVRVKDSPFLNGYVLFLSALVLVGALGIHAYQVERNNEISSTIGMPSVDEVTHAQYTPPNWLLSFQRYDELRTFVASLLGRLENVSNDAKLVHARFDLDAAQADFVFRATDKKRLVDIYAQLAAYQKDSTYQVTTRGMTLSKSQEQWQLSASISMTTEAPNDR